MSKVSVESFKDPQDFLDYYGISEDMAAHLKYLTLESALERKEINQRSYNILKHQGIKSLYDLSMSHKKDLYELRNLGSEAIEKYIAPWHEAHYAPWRNDYMSKDALMAKLLAGRDYFNETYLNQHKVMDVDVKEVPEETAALTAQQAHIRSFVIAGEEKHVRDLVIKAHAPAIKENKEFLDQTLEEAGGALGLLNGIHDPVSHETFDLVSDAYYKGYSYLQNKGLATNQMGQDMEAQMAERGLSLTHRDQVEADYNAYIDDRLKEFNDNGAYLKERRIANKRGVNAARLNRIQ